MEDKNLIAKIKILGNIQPDREWVVLTKKNILRDNMSHQNLIFEIGHFVFQKKLVFAGLTLICLLGATFMVTQDSSKPVQLANLELATQKLAELNLMSGTQADEAVKTAVKEYSATKSAARKQVLEMVRKDPDNAGKIVKSVGSQIQQIDATERQVFAALGVEDDVQAADNSSENPDKAIVELLIDDAQKMNLTAMQSQDIAYMQGLFSAGNYEGALEFYLNSSLSQQN